MPFDTLFRAANALALCGWLALIVLPRRPWLRTASLAGLVGGLCVAYAALVHTFFFAVPGGGFGSLQAVQTLFTAPGVALAGWLHYLAFDLFVGWWIAGRADEAGVSRWLQAPVLATTFLFGPVGLLLAGAGLAALRARHRLTGAAP